MKLPVSIVAKVENILEEERLVEVELVVVPLVATRFVVVRLVNTAEIAFNNVV